METKTIIIISVSSVLGLLLIIGLTVYFLTKDSKNPTPVPTCGEKNCEVNQKCVMDECKDYCSGSSNGCDTGNCICPTNKICSQNTCTSTCGPDDTCGGLGCQCGANETCDHITNKCVLKTCGESKICSRDLVQFCDCVSPSTCNIVSGNCVENDQLNTLFKSKITGNIKQVQNKYIMSLKKEAYFLCKEAGSVSFLPLCTWDKQQGTNIGKIIFIDPDNYFYTQYATTMTPTQSSTEFLQIGTEQISLTQMKIIKGQRFKIDSTFNGSPTNYYANSAYMQNKGTTPGYFEIEFDIDAPQDESQYTAFDPVSETYNDNFVYTGDQLDGIRGLYNILLIYYDNTSSTDGRYWGNGTSGGKSGLTVVKEKAFRFQLTPKLQWFTL